ncbi:MAG: hypothetical protein K6G42_06320 [Lachnospiraceae bacterium]|nr:hypothetical protein [Lachnospiraceae bacterium]
MKRNNLLLFVMLLGLLLNLILPSVAYAEETVSVSGGAGEGGSESSGTEGSDTGGAGTGSTGEVSGNDPSSVSEDELSKITIVCNTFHDGNSGVGVKVNVDSVGSGISLIQAENIAVGIRKTLYGPKEISADINEDHAEAKLRITANGVYMFYAYDGKAVSDTCEVRISDIPGAGFQERIEEAEKNRNGSTVNTSGIDTDDGSGDDGDGGDDDRGTEGNFSGSVILGGAGQSGAIPSSAGIRDYTVKSRDDRERSDLLKAGEKYSGWSLLNRVGDKGDLKAWYGTDYDLTKGGSETDRGPLYNVMDLSDYETGVFSRELSVAGEKTEVGTEDPESLNRDLKSLREDDNIANAGKNRNRRAFRFIALPVISVMMFFGILTLIQRIKILRNEKAGYVICHGR